VLVLAALHLVLAVVPGPRLSPSINLVLFATNLYVLHCASGLLASERARGVVLFALGYAVLFLLTVAVLDKKPLFILLVILYASVFRSTFLLGLLAIFVLSFVVLQPYAVETFVPLVFIFVVVFGVRRRSPFLAAALGFGLVALTIVLLPLLHLAVQDSVQTLWRTFLRPDVLEALGLSLATGGVATAIVALFGVPLAYALARLDFGGRRFVEAVIDVPIVVPQSVAGIAFMVMLGPGSPLGSALDRLVGVQVAGRVVGIVLAQVFVAAPFLVKAAMAAFEAVPARLEMASRTLGASAAQTFVRVALPLAGRGIFVGMILAFARAVSELGTLLLFASSPVTAPVLAHDEFLRAGVAESRPIAVLLLVSCLWVFVLLQLGARWLPFGRAAASRGAP
jgi:molybdate/tungstate transport system permease protein